MRFFSFNNESFTLFLSIHRQTHTKDSQFAKVACLESFFTWVPRPSGSKFRLIILQFNSFLFFATFVQPFFGKVKGAVCGLLKKTFNKQKRQQLTPSSFSSWFFFQYSACVYVYFITQVVGKRRYTKLLSSFFSKGKFSSVSVIFSSMAMADRDCSSRHTKQSNLSMELFV